MLAGPALKDEPVTLGWIWTKLAASESHTLSKDTSLQLFQSQRAPLEYREQDFTLSFSPSHVLSFAPALHSPTPSLNLPLSSLSSRPSLLALFSLKPLHLFVYPAVSFSSLPPQHIICETGFAGLDATAADTGIWFLSSGLFNLSHSICVFFWAPSTICFKERKKNPFILSTGERRLVFINLLSPHVHQHYCLPRLVSASPSQHPFSIKHLTVLSLPLGSSV